MPKFGLTIVCSIPALLLLVGCSALQPQAEPPPPAPEPPPVVAQYIVPPGMEFVSGLFGYSQAVRVGPWVTVAAVPGFDVAKRGFPDAFEDQVAAAFQNLDAVLKISGVQRHEVVEISTWQLDMDAFNATIDARNEFFGEHRPAWSAMGVKALPMPSMQFQVSVRAYSPDGIVFPPAIRNLDAPPAPAVAPPAAATPAASTEEAIDAAEGVSDEASAGESDRKGVNKRFRNRPGQW